MGMLVILLAFMGTSLFAQQRQVSTHKMERIVNSAAQDSEQAYKMAMNNYKGNERQIDQLMSKIEDTLVAIENRQNKGEKLTTAQEQKIRKVMANGVSITRMMEKANR